jgi:hypothetical protein
LNKKKLNILHIGPVISENQLLKIQYLSNAASKWQLCFRNALSPFVENYFIFSYLPDYYFPKGKLFPRLVKFESNYNIIIIRYLNLFFIRNISLVISYLNAYRNLHYTPDIIITYNSLLHNSFFALLLKKYFKIKWINIVADDIGSKYADKSICLSYWTYNNIKIPNKIYFPGFIEKPIFAEFKKEEKLKIFYCGAINNWTGILEFIKMFDLLNLPNVELHIYGSANDSLKTFLYNLSFKNIFYHGFVTNSQLEIDLQSASAFINPRPSNIIDSEKNFPSKVLYYLKFLKPIISTNTGGLSNEFQEIFYIYQNDDLSSFRNVIYDILNMDENSYNFLCEKYLNICNKYSLSNAKNLFLIND